MHAITNNDGELNQLRDHRVDVGLGVATAKYRDALPLYRQAALLERFGGDLSRNTLVGSLVRVGTAVLPVINLLRDQLLDAEIIHGDETELQVLKEPGRSAQQKSYLWA